MKKQTEALMDALNIIDEQAELAGVTYEEAKARSKAYELLAKFILSKNK